MQHWLQELYSQFLPVARQRLHQAQIRARIVAQFFSRKIDIFIQARGRAVIERMREWNFWLNPCEAMLFERKCLEKW